ncbi:MAG: GerMN domain-containing protein [Armatimonadetes bacterium]|nr:GerMN domain-containing protein [Armatimonadota bacterium]
MRRALAAALIILLPPLVWWFFIRPIPVDVTIYFTRGADQESTLAPVVRTVRARSTESRLREAYRALLAGPTAEERAVGLSSEIPAGTGLRGIVVGGGVAAVDFTAEVERGGGSSSMQGRVWQIVYTGTQFPAASKVRILIEGQHRQALGGEGVIIDMPIPRPTQTPTF